MDLRDQKSQVKWLVDVKDNEYEKQMYSEELREEVDKKTGQKKARWIKIGDANNYLDCEAENLTLAIRYNLFSPTSVNEEELKKIIPNQEKPSSPS
jgi:NAD dependent epimerase/dehydratase family enzyme